MNGVAGARILSLLAPLLLLSGPPTVEGKHRGYIWPSHAMERQRFSDEANDDRGNLQPMPVVRRRFQGPRRRRKEPFREQANDFDDNWKPVSAVRQRFRGRPANDDRGYLQHMPVVRRFFQGSRRRQPFRGQANDIEHNWKLVSAVRDAFAAGEGPDTYGPNEPPYKPLALYECPWFTDVLRTCFKGMAAERDLSSIFIPIATEQANHDTMACLTKNVVHVPDGIYCTEKESVSVISDCFMETFEKYNRDEEDNTNLFVSELGNCMNARHIIEVERLKSR